MMLKLARMQQKIKIIQNFLPYNWVVSYKHIYMLSLYWVHKFDVYRFYFHYSIISWF